MYGTDRKEVSLADYLGKECGAPVFPAAFTGTCTEQMCSSQDDANLFNDLNAVVLGFPWIHRLRSKEFKEKNGLNFELLSDANKRTIHDLQYVLVQFSPVISGGVASRGVVVIDGTGTVAYTEETANPGVQVNSRSPGSPFQIKIV